MKAFFIDRDGTLNIDSGYINNPDNLSLYHGVENTLKFIKSKNYCIFIITNQSGICRGRITPEEYRRVNDKFTTLVGRNIIDEILYCPHVPSVECSCRKPKTMLLEIVIEHYKINSSESYFIGDKISDIACGKKLGLKTVLISDGENPVSAFDEKIIPDKIVKSISELRQLVVKLVNT